MRIVPCAVVACAFLVVGVPGSASAQIESGEASEYVADMNLLLGQKHLDRDDWGKDLDTQLELGLEATWRKEGWPVAVATDVTWSTASKNYGGGVKVQGTTMEWAAGVRKTLVFGRIRPQAGAGVEWVQAGLKVESAGSSAAGEASGFGLWAGTGLVVRVGRSANVGASVRYSAARVKSGDFTKPFEAGGLHYGLSVGFGLPPFEEDGIR